MRDKMQKESKWAVSAFGSVPKLSWNQHWS